MTGLTAPENLADAGKLIHNTVQLAHTALPHYPPVFFSIFLPLIDMKVFTYLWCAGPTP